MRSKKILLALIAIWVITLYPVSLFAQQSIDCRQKKPTPGGALDLAGVWMDNSVNLKVTITQDGIDLREIINVQAKYLVPYKCAQNSDDGKAVLLDLDFVGRLSKPNLGSRPEIEGAVFICQDVRGPNNTLYSERVQGTLTLTVNEARDSMTGLFVDPGKGGSQHITLTRLSKIETPTYIPQTMITTRAAAKIYEEPLRSSKVRYTPPAGTQLIFENDHTVLDADGNPLWYFVVNAGGESIGSTNSGWIRASQIACVTPNTKIAQ